MTMFLLSNPTRRCSVVSEKKSLFIFYKYHYVVFSLCFAVKISYVFNFLLDLSSKWCRYLLANLHDFPLELCKFVFILFCIFREHFYSGFFHFLLYFYFGELQLWILCYCFHCIFIILHLFYIFFVRTV